MKGNTILRYYKDTGHACFRVAKFITMNKEDGNKCFHVCHKEIYSQQQSYKDF